MKRLVFAWIALLALLFASLAASHFHLGIGNTVAGVGIAAVKALIVGWVFMQLGTATPLIRLIAAAAVGAWLLLAGLSLVDFLPRSHDPAAYQSPLQIEPALAQPKR